MKRVLLDAGHGGNATGAVIEDVMEKHTALQVTLATGKILNRIFPGIDVCYTRIQDKAVSLTARYNLIKAIEPNAFVSIHCNAVDNSDVNGFEVFYRDAYDIDLAKSIHQLFKRADIWKTDRGVKQDEQWLGKRLTVLNHLEVPSCLVEIGFLSNAKERDKILQCVQGISDLIAHGIAHYFEEQNKNG